MSNLRLIQRAAYPFIGPGAFGDGHSWYRETPGSPDLPGRVQSLLDEFSTISGGYPDSGASLTFNALDRIYLDMGFLLQRVVSTWAERQGMDSTKVEVDFALSVKYTSIIESATYLGTDISAQLHDALVSWLPMDRPMGYRPAKPLADAEIARVVAILDALADES